MSGNVVAECRSTGGPHAGDKTSLADDETGFRIGRPVGRIQGFQAKRASRCLLASSRASESSESHPRSACAGGEGKAIT